jgi:cyclophilin family peptidyl-prolyl cis-trans isomerase
MRHRQLLLVTFAVVALAGAGCANQPGSQVAVGATGANADSALAPRELDLNRASGSAPAEANSKSDSNPSNMPTPSTKGAYAFPGVLPSDEIHGKQVRIVTDKGEIVFDLLDGEAPKTVSNFVYLARQGYFNGLKFHRVVPHFVIQGGDPLSADESKRQIWGTGGPGYKFEDEKVKLDYDAGIVAMANSGPNTNGSQFFIMIDDNPTLPKDYTIFGRVTKGQDVVRSINVGDVMNNVTVEAK